MGLEGNISFRSNEIVHLNYVRSSGIGVVSVRLKEAVTTFSVETSEADHWMTRHETFRREDPPNSPNL